MRKLITFCFALSFAALHASAAVMPAEKLLPDDTLVMFTMPDFNQVRNIYQNSPQGKLWNDPAMKDFKDKFIAKLNSQYLTPLEHDLGVHFSDYAALPQGQITVAMIQNGWQNKDGQAAALLLLVDVKDKSSQLTTNLADLKKKWIDAGKTVKTEKIRDVDFSVITVSASDLPKSMKGTNDAPSTTADSADISDAKKAKKPIYIGQTDSLLIVGDSPKVIEKLLVRISGGSVKTLSDTPSFQSSANMFHDSPAFGWINIKGFVDIFGHPADDEASTPPTNPLGIDFKKVIGAIGLNGLKTISFAYLYSPDGAQFNVMAAAPEAERTGLLKIFAGEAKDCTPLPFVPADAVKYQRWRLDGQKTYATLRKIIGDISPVAIGTVDFAIGSAEAAAKEKDPNFDLNKYLFGNLGDDIITYQKTPKGDTLAAANSPPSIFLLGSPNPEQLASALKSLLVLYSSQSQSITDREFLGHKIYTVPLPPTPGPDGTAVANSISYASGGGYLAISSDNALLEEYLRSSENPPKALRDTPGLSDAEQKVSGTGTSLFGYANDKESMRVLFNVMKKDPSSGDAATAGLAPVTAAMGMKDMKTSDWLDVSLLPPFDAVSKYFYFSVYGLSASSDGLSFKAFAPTPPELKK